MLRYVAKRLGFVAGSLAVAAAVLYAVSPWILAALGSAWLENLGAYAVKVEAGYPRPGSLRLEAVHARLTDGGARYRAAANGVTLRYHLSALVRGRLAGVYVESADVAVDSGTPLEARDLAALFAMSGDWIRRLPLENAAVETLALRIGGRGRVATEARLSGELAATGERLSAAVDVALGQGAVQRVIADLGADGRTSIAVRTSAAGDTAPWLVVEAAPGGARAVAVSGRVDTPADAAATVLGPLLPAVPVDDMAGRVSGDWALVLPDDPEDWTALLLAMRGDLRLHADLDTRGDSGARAALLEGEVALSAGARQFTSAGALDAAPGVIERVLAPFGLATPWPQDVPGSVSVSWEASMPTAGTRTWTSVRDDIRLRADIRAAAGDSAQQAAAHLRGDAQVSLAGGSAESSGSVRGDAALLTRFLARWVAGSAVAGAAGDVDLRWAGTAPLSAPDSPDGWLGVLQLDAGLAGDVNVDAIDGVARDLAVSGSVAAVLRGGRLQLSAEPGLRVRGMPEMPGWRDAAAPLTLLADDGVALELSMHARRYRLSVPAGTEVELQGLVVADFGAPAVRVRALEDIELTRAGGDAWAYDAVSLAVRAPSVLANLKAIGSIDNASGELLITAPAGADAAPALTLRNVRLNALGGSLSAQRIALGGAGEPSELAVDVSAIDLGRIVRLEQQPGLQASGRVDGRVTLLIDGSGGVSGSGRFTGRAPGGVIRYQPDPSARQMVDANPGMKFAHDALGNLHYDALLADARYARDGRLVLHLRIEGVNPDWRPDQPVHLNLNLEENIPRLLESLRLTDDFARVIEQRVRDLSAKRRDGA